MINKKISEKIYERQKIKEAPLCSRISGCALLPPTVTAKPGANTDIIKEAWDIINKEYVEPSRLNSANMTRAAIDGIIETLNDPYTTYLSADEFKMGQSSISGEFEGIGATVNVQDKNIVVINPMAGSPAESAGIKAGDIIKAIDGVSTEGLTLNEAVSKIRGPKGTAVTLTILHKNETAPVNITITRNTVELASVKFEMRGSTAYIILAQFTGRTETEFAPLLKKLKDNNATGIVLDMRGNPGGLLDIVVDVASHFLTQGIVVQVRSREGVVSVENVKKGYEVTTLPMVVLVDENSASGAEVLSGALQDQNRALIAGNVTYGKGSVNYLHQLSDGSGIYITSARWLTPNGRMIEGHGIEPDIKLQVTGDDALNWALDYLKKSSR
jgi:carboxyl-terminal processing protease